MNPELERAAKALLGKGRAAWARNFQVISGFGYPKIFDAGAQWSLRTAAQILPFAWARDLASETANKQHAFSEFQNARRGSWREEPLDKFFSGDPHLDIWRAEGLGARFAEHTFQSSAPVRLRDLASRDDVPASFLLPLHTGGGLSLAEKAIRNHLRNGKQFRIEVMLSEFEFRLAEQGEPALRDATFEALGLVLQTLFPELLVPVTDSLRERNPTGYGLIWHGAGRGHYFDPFQLLVPSALRRQSYLSPTDGAGLNRLAGYAWASTMVNLRSPATAATVIASLPLINRDSLAAAADGISAAALVWLAMTNDRSPVERLQIALGARGLFRNRSAAPTITAALTRRLEAHPASSEALGKLFCFSPD